MEKYELSIPEKIIMVLIYTILPALVFAIIQSAVTHNRVYFGWLILLGIVGAMYLVGGSAMVTVPVRFRVKEDCVFQHYKTYMVKNGIVAAGRYFRNYPVFILIGKNNSVHSEAIGPVAASEINGRFEKGKVCSVWINEHHPSQCCTDRYRVVVLGVIELAVAAALFALIIVLA